MLKKDKNMLNTSFIKTFIYTGVFACGYAAAHLNTEQKSIKPETPSITNLQIQKTQEVNIPIVAPIQPQTASELPAEVSMVHCSEVPRKDAAGETLEDFDNPDAQIQLALIEDTVAFTQANEQSVQNPDPLDLLFRLPEDQQMAYIQKLVESQEDAAVVALNDLILNDNPPVQKAAIDGLLFLLEMHTGHFALIAENMEQNAVFLNDEQLERFNKAKQQP